MRVVLSSTSRRWGGVQRVTEILARGLLARGHQVITFARANSALERKLRSLVPVEPILGGMDLHPVAMTRIANALRQHRPDVLVALMKKDVRQAVPVAHVLDVPTVVRHPNDQPLRKHPYHRLLYGLLSTHHVTNAESTRSTLLESAPYLDEDDITVIYNGIDVAMFDKARPMDLGLPRGAIALGYVGKLETRKGVLDLARAWPVVSAASPRAHLVIAGIGALEGEMKAMLAGDERVRWLGHRNDVPALMKALDLLVLPSYVEGAPNVLLEAMAAGIPAVATAVSGTPELVRAGTTAELLPPNEPALLATTMLSLIDAPARRRAMGRSARAHVERHFRLDEMIDRYEHLLEDVSRSGGAKRRERIHARGALSRDVRRQSSHRDHDEAQGRKGRRVG